MAPWLLTLLALLGFGIAQAEAQHVFCHVLVGTTVGYTVANWENDIQLAASFGIEAFALNIGTPLQGITATQVANAFQAAAALNSSFKLFFSFDYLGGTAGAWQTSDIVNLLQNYTTSPSYFQYQGRPFVSTFEGPTVSNVNQWSTIRSSISGGIYFVPDWSSQGPGYNMNLYDGAFSWTMWPDGPNQMTTAPDQQWTSSLTPANKTYMMGVSPWFYTDLPAYNKAWVWRGDRLWFDRWQETQQVLPQFVEIVSWNDWGESHYISPIYQPGIPDAANADATVYVDGYPHSAWLQTLPYQIAAYKHAYNSNNPAPSVPVGQDKIVFWYRTSPAASGSTDCTGNCAQSNINTGGYQTYYSPSQILEDNIFAIVLLAYPASVSIAIGNNVTTFPNLPAGINLVNRTFDGFTGPVTVKSSSGAIGMGVNITSAPASGVANFNAFVGLASIGSGTQSASPTSSPTSAASTNTTAVSTATTSAGSANTTSVSSTTTGAASTTSNSTANTAASTTTNSTASATTATTTTGTANTATSGTTSGATSSSTSGTSSSGSSSTSTSGTSTPASTTTVYVTNTVSVPTTVTTTATSTSTFTQPASTVTSTVSSPTTVTSTASVATTTTDVVPTTTTQTATATVTQTPVTNTVTSTSTVTPAPVTTTATSTVTQTPVTNTVTSTSTLTQSPVTTTATSTVTQSPVRTTATSTVTQSPVTTTATSTLTQTPVTNTVTSTSTFTQPANTVTSTSTLTQPPNTVTSTSTLTQPPNTVTSTSTLTQPPNTVTSTSTLTQPPNTVTSTSTLTQPPNTVTSTSTLTQPAVTSTVTSTQSASTVTTTLTQPASTTTKTVTQPPVTNTVTSTVTQPAKTSTVTQPASTVTSTSTLTQPAKTVTSTVTKTTTKK